MTMSFRIFTAICPFSCNLFNTGCSRAPADPPAAARPHHARLTQQPSVSPVKERARQPNRRAGSVASWSLGLENHRYILFWVSGRALDFGGQKRGFKSPLLCFFRGLFQGVGGWVWTGDRVALRNFFFCSPLVVLRRTTGLFIILLGLPCLTMYFFSHLGQIRSDRS